MKKQISVTGNNGTFIGYIEVLLNYRYETKWIHCRGTHDDKEIRVGLHKVAGFIGETEKFKVEFEEDDKIVERANYVETKVNEYLHILADRHPFKTPGQYLAEMGYS